MLSFKGNLSCSNDRITRPTVLCVKMCLGVCWPKALEDVPAYDHI